MRRLLITAAAATLAATPALASGFHDLAAIDRQVAAFLGAGIGDPGGAQAPVNRQLRLVQCSQTPLLDWQGTDGQAVRVRCPDVDGWRLFVPVMASPRAAEEDPVVARRDLLRIEASGPGFRIARTGEALDAGHVGSLIRVRIDDGTRAGRVISAEVVAAGRARVPLG